MVRAVAINGKASAVMKNIGYAFSSNLFAAAISFAITLIVPKALGVEEFGYWQLYALYASYVGLFHFGLNDGVYLRYGGMYYEQLDKPLLHSQYIAVGALQFIVGCVICALSLAFIGDARYAAVMMCAGLCCVLTNPRAMLSNCLQMTGRVKEYARNTIIEKVIYAGLVIPMALLFQVRRFSYLILADVVAKLIVSVSCAFACREIVFSKGVSIRAGLAEARKNVSAGIKLLIAQFSAMFALGIARLTIEGAWGIAVFGKVSLAMSVSAALMVFISAAGVVMFPVFKRMNPESMGVNYKNVRFLIVLPALGLMLACFPGRLLLAAWLPGYADSAVYLTMLFPLCLFEGRISVLTNNFFKALRMEKAMLYVNAASVLVSAVVSAFGAYALGSLPFCVLSIVMISCFRCLLSEHIVTKRLGINVSRDVVAEVLMVAVFVGTGCFLKASVALPIYGICYGAYLFSQRGKIRAVKRVIFAG